MEKLDCKKYKVKILTRKVTVGESKLLDYYFSTVRIWHKNSKASYFLGFNKDYYTFCYDTKPYKKAKDAKNDALEFCKWKGLKV
jgi:hypothetical protein